MTEQSREGISVQSLDLKKEQRQATYSNMAATLVQSNEGKSEDNIQREKQDVTRQVTQY